jgi:hypothetical protein
MTIQLLPPADGSSADASTPPDGSSPTAAERCANEPLPSEGAVYFTCDCQPGADPSCEPGNDGYAGTDIAAPWRSFERARAQFAGLAAGDTIAFCRGGRFTSSAEGLWVNGSCRADRRCTVRDYAPPWGDGSQGRPIIDSTTLRGPFALENLGNATHEEGYRILNLVLRNAGSADAFGVFAHNDIDDVELCNLLIEGFNIGVFVAHANAPEPTSDGLNQRIALRGSRIVGSLAEGYSGACDGCVVEECSFEPTHGDGSSIVAWTNTDGAGTAVPTRGLRIVHNRITISRASSTCSAPVVSVAGKHEALVIEGNEISAELGLAADGCSGIAIAPESIAPCYFRDVIVRANRLTNLGRFPLEVSACQRCLIENNVIEQAQARESIGIAVPRSPRDPARGDDETTAATLRNNTVYFGAAASGTAIYLGTEGRDHVAASNALFYAGTDLFSCFGLDLPVSGYTVVDNNLCYAPQAPTARWELGSGTLGTWKATSGLDASSLFADPRFAAPPGDLSPGADSALIGRAHPTQHAAQDFAGKSRDVAPDIGAFER